MSFNDIVHNYCRINNFHREFPWHWVAPECTESGTREQKKGDHGLRAFQCNITIHQVRTLGFRWHENIRQRIRIFLRDVPPGEFPACNSLALELTHSPLPCGCERVPKWLPIAVANRLRELFKLYARQDVDCTTDDGAKKLLASWAVFSIAIEVLAGRTVECSDKPSRPEAARALKSLLLDVSNNFSPMQMNEAIALVNALAA